MKAPFEVDSRGQEFSERDPLYYVLIDADGRVICDTMNCDQFDPQEQRRHLEALAQAMNAHAAAAAEPEIRCINCRFYHVDDEECRRHAPRPRYVADERRDERTLSAEGDDDFYRRATWPQVYPFGDWCGDFEPVDGDEVKKRAADFEAARAGQR